MTTARELFQAGKLNEAVRALNAELRDNPADVKRRTFLFELLCFTGEFDRAEKQLDILGKENKDADMGSLLYRGAIAAERTRQEMFAKKDVPPPKAGDQAVRGTLNGKPFEDLTDADPRIGRRLEVFAAGSYLWMSFHDLATVVFQPPRRLRDLMWATALVRVGPSFKGVELGEVLVPALSPSACAHPDDLVRLGRTTNWEELEDGQEVPVGQKMLLVDGEEFPILELRSLEFTAAEGATP
jgi:type VI secretion system protein ImpE